MKVLHKLLPFALDILLAAVLLFAFAYVHHGRAFLRGETAVDPSSAVALPSAAVPTPEPIRSADKFTDGSIEQTDSSYKSANVNVSWTRHEDSSGTHKVVYYIADVYPLPSHRRARDSGCGDTGDRYVLQQRHVLYCERSLQIHGAHAVRLRTDAVIGNPVKSNDCLFFRQSLFINLSSAKTASPSDRASRGGLNLSAPSFPLCQ